MTDRRNRPLAEATITGGTKDPGGTGGNPQTDSGGHYTVWVKANQVGGFLGAYKTGYGSQSKPLGASNSEDPTPPPVVIDFSLPYYVAFSVSPLAFNAVPQLLTFDVYTTAPSPEVDLTGTSQAKVDLPSGTIPLSKVTQTAEDPAGQVHWRGTWTLPAGSADGVYQFSTCVLDPNLSVNCQSSADTLLSEVKTGRFILDRSPPNISDLTPEDRSNTMFSSQPLMVRVDDQGGAGVLASGISFLLRDETASAEVTRTAVSYDPTSKWAKTAPVSLTDGHRYSVTATVADVAGNYVVGSQSASSSGGGFTRMSVSPSGSWASIATTPCVVGSQIDISTQTKQATCYNVPLHIAASSVTVTASAHGFDFGFVGQTASLGNAIIQTDLAGVPFSQTAFSGADPAWNPRTLSTIYQVTETAALPQLLVTSARDVNLGTLSSRVPATWDHAQLSMASSTTTASIATCADPSLSLTSISCSTDPLSNRYAVILKRSSEGGSSQTVGDIATAQLDESGLLRGSLDDSANHYYEAELPLSLANSIAGDSRTKLVAPLGSLEANVHNDIGFRRLISFNADPSYVASLYADPALTAGLEVRGAVFTPAEDIEIRRRLALQEDAWKVTKYVQDNFLGSIYGDMFLDHEGGGKLVVSFTSNVFQHFAALSVIMNDPERLEARQVARALPELEQVKSQVIALDADLLEGGFQMAGVGISVQDNKVTLLGNDLRPGGCDAAVATFPSESVRCGIDPPHMVGGGETDCLKCLVLTAASTKSRANSDPPWRAGITINPVDGLGDQSKVMTGLCTLGYAVVKAGEGSYNLSDDHCFHTHPDDQIDPNADIHHSTHTIGRYDSGVTNRNLGVDAAAFDSNPNNEAEVYSEWPQARKVTENMSNQEGANWIICMSGAASFHHCGKVYYQDQATWIKNSVTSQKQLWDHIGWVTENNDQNHAIDGDSGAPEYIPTSSGTDARAVGLLEATDATSLNQGGTLFHYYTHLKRPDGSFTLPGFSLRCTGGPC